MEYAGQINEYRCSRCGTRKYTVLLANGTTPFMRRCNAGEPEQLCQGQAMSTMFKIIKAPYNITCSLVSYRPAQLPVLGTGPEYYDREATVEHLLRGGLVDALPGVPLDMAPPWDPDEESWEAYALRAWSVDIRA